MRLLSIARISREMEAKDTSNQTAGSIYIDELPILTNYHIFNAPDIVMHKNRAQPIWVLSEYREMAAIPREFNSTHQC
ncbi:MAG: hypothetical protein EON54_05575 [Alcaligenaceae bacterium]|nr:MAG: hypothetical protein EON54_05575 [Alcaligenaceae bacterium]